MEKCGQFIKDYRKRVVYSAGHLLEWADTHTENKNKIVSVMVEIGERKNQHYQQ